jgi:hypothetical protein
MRLAMCGRANELQWRVRRYEHGRDELRHVRDELRSWFNVHCGRVRLRSGDELLQWCVHQYVQRRSELRHVR